MAEGMEEQGAAMSRLIKYRRMTMNFPWEMYVGDSGDEQPTPINEIYAPPKLNEVKADTPEEKERLWQLVVQASQGN